MKNKLFILVSLAFLGSLVPGISISAQTRTVPSSMNVKIENIGKQPVILTSVEVTGHGSTCPKTLLPGESCVATVLLKPAVKPGSNRVVMAWAELLVVVLLLMVIILRFRRRPVVLDQ